VRRIDATKPIYHLRHVELAPNGAVEDFLFEVDITAVVRLRAADEGAARRAISTVLQAPSAAEIGLLNEANSFFTGATVTDVDFLQLGPAQIMSILVKLRRHLKQRHLRPEPCDLEAAAPKGTQDATRAHRRADDRGPGAGDGHARGCHAVVHL
jgi:hypothetical protein